MSWGDRLRLVSFDRMIQLGLFFFKLIALLPRLLIKGLIAFQMICFFIEIRFVCLKEIRRNNEMTEI